MSATNRGSERIAQDNYPTPLTAFEPLIPFLPADGPVWEPACGDGRLISAMRQYGIDADGNDIVNGYDFLKDGTRRFSIVTNPPFSLAFEFAQWAVGHAVHVFLLLRLNFLASGKRREWFSTHEPNALFVLCKRPSFVNGGTDCTDYAWYYWGPSVGGIHHI